MRFIQYEFGVYDEYVRELRFSDVFKTLIIKDVIIEHGHHVCGPMTSILIQYTLEQEPHIVEREEIKVSCETIYNWKSKKMLGII